MKTTYLLSKQQATVWDDYLNNEYTLFCFFFNLKNFTKKWLQNWNFPNLYAATKNLASTLYAWSGLTLKSIFWKKKWDNSSSFLEHFTIDIIIW